MCVFCCHAVQLLIVFLSFFLSSFSVGWCVALWDFRLPALSLFLLLVEVGVCFFGAVGLLPALGCSSSSLSGCGLWSVFVFWRSGTSAHVEVSILFFVWVFCPSVVSLFFLVAVAGNCSLLLVAAAGVSLLGALWLLPGLGCFWFGGWGRCLLIGALGLLPALG